MINDLDFMALGRMTKYLAKLKLLAHPPAFPFMVPFLHSTFQHQIPSYLFRICTKSKIFLSNWLVTNIILEAEITKINDSNLPDS